MINWTFDKIARLQELVCSPEEYSESQIASILTKEFEETFSRDAVHNKILRLNLRELIDKPITDFKPYYNKYRDIIEGEGEVQKVFNVSENQVAIKIPKDRLKILHLGDLHIPFQNDEQVQIAINRNRTADIVVAVEMSDCYSISRFNKNLSVPFEVEIDNIVRYYEYLSETFPLIFVVSGNHEKRINKSFFKGVPPSLLFLVKTNMMRLLARPFPNIIVFDRPIIQINDAIFTHAEYFSKIDLKSGINAYNFLAEWKKTLDLDDYSLVVQSHCLSDDTEILTNNGWKLHNEISIEDEVLTLNTKNNQLEYNKINGIFRYDTFKEMIPLSGRKDFDLLVTTDHRMIYRNGEGYSECKAKDLKPSYMIPLAGNFVGEELPYSESFLKLIGLIISEGSFLTDNSTSGVRIYQSWSNRKIVTDLLDELGKKYTVTRKRLADRKVGDYTTKDDEAIIYINAESARDIHELLRGNKNIPTSLLNMCEHQFMALLDGLMSGDDTYYKDKRGGQYYTGNVDLANRLQELCVKHNLKSTLRSRVSGVNNTIGYVLTWYKKNMSTYQGNLDTVPYDGIAWCVSVDNGTIVVRRNGKTAIVGNTHMLGATYRQGGELKVMESGCLCRIPDYAVVNFYSKPQINGYVVVVQKNGRTDFDLTREYSFGTQKYIPAWSPLDREYINGL